MPVRMRFNVIQRAPREARTSADGRVFHSVGEMNRYQDLVRRQQRGEVRDLKCQVRYPLSVGGQAVMTEGAKPRVRTYTVDFEYEELVFEISSHGLPTEGQWKRVYEEYKGVDDKASELRRSMFRACYGVDIKITGPARKPGQKKKKKNEPNSR